MLTRRRFVAAISATTFAAGVSRLVQGAEEGAAPFKTVLRKALIRPRLTLDVVKTLKENGYPGVELQDKAVTEAEARDARRLAENEGLQIHSFMGGWFAFNQREPDRRKAEIEKAKQNMRIAKVYGAPVILIVPGRVAGMPMPKPSEFRLAFDPETVMLSRAADADYPEYVQAQNDATKYAQDAIAELAPYAADL